MKNDRVLEFVQCLTFELFRDELAREREEKARLRQEMLNLSDLQQRKTNDTSVPPLPDDIEERKKIFDETVERVQEKFFAYHRENVCADNEKEIMECLKANPGRILQCAHLTDPYEKCVADFRQEVLKGN
ncbi:unnamed protein product [Cylicostephanus goldi]|uniref:Uncharacterized protein n=1 Tax=Cylicostephanus goldi TaxID=71465 RepID=A0A3P6S830_CYLGO|nr:unnamed protein product [Cylicostephanus goldi]